jgi:hypothetical protein
MTSTINGAKVTVSACREWGAFLLGGRLIVLDQYPLQALNSIEVPGGQAPESTEAPAEMQPILEQKTVTAKYRVTETEENRISFTPLQRVQRLEGGGLTELVDLHLSLHDEKLKADFGGMKIGDEKEFTVGITVVTGYRRLAHASDTPA